MKTKVISITNLTKTYQLYESHADRVKEAFHPFRKKFHRPFHALKNVSLDIYQGEFVGIIGRNGSGKSTLLQLITGILQPTSGTISVNGQISALLELGAGFNPEFTGRENVYLNASILGISRAEIAKNFPNIEEFADIGDFIDQPVKTYSSGMFVRLAFAIAINVKPDIFIVDEALAVGDMFFQQKCIRHMEEKMRTCTKVLVTHDMHAVTNLCKRVIVLDHGELIYTGSPLEGVEYYTKAVHNELFRKKEELSTGKTTSLVSSTMSAVEKDFSWVDVKSESTAGASEVVIKKVNLRSDTKDTVTTVVAGDLLNIRMIVEAFAPLDKVIFGYIIKDRVGNGISGDNSLSLDGRPYALTTGQQMVSLEIRWPDIAPDEYIITLGIGQGEHPLHHVIQCWAHNVLLVKALSSGKAVHGIFTNPLLECEVQPID
jgi:ABC-type polysaccharide/polyol phosphate transport system ATPase subunit